MVSLKKLLLFGAALVSAVPLDSIVVREPDIANVTGDGPLSVNHAKPTFDLQDLEARQGPRQGLATLQWSPQGRIIFLMGLKLPQAVLEGFYGLGEAGPAKALVEEFRQYLSDNSLMGANALWIQATKGGVYGKGAGAIADTFGFGIQTKNFPDAGQIQTLLDAIHAWASRTGDIVRVIARPNNFFDLGTIGAGGETDLLQYATEALPDIDINSQIRWGGTCDE